ncbi:pectin acetylesterase-family hydrolase [Nannocystis sp.]|uniref:pectin acetylesterase-family hydrolase n=1 Tax=Nannocystis sp. TaxID=1962667 RepID=UPI0025F61A5A|nr:pectin acetylesterase-family hydrolase [Nannocystis sp.]MBK7824733.1 hypothetical protein [Nannocystis sp.]
MRRRVAVPSLSLVLGTACGEGYLAPFADDESGAGTSSSSASEGSGASESSSASASSGSDAPEDPPLPPFDGEPLPDAPEGVWTWVDFPDSRCRDGSSTGIGVRYGASDNLVIYFEGGGACFNGFTCLANDPHFDADDFVSWRLGEGHGGIFNDARDDNPVQDWSFIYVPYCSGDVHAGDNTGVEIADVVGVQDFAGYTNVELFLERIVPSFGAAPHVLVTGVSAGGFGAGFNYHRLARVFPAKVTLLDDSGPPLRDEYLTPCLQQMWREVWGLADTLPPGCEGCNAIDGGGISELIRYIAQAHPEQRMGLVSSEGDQTIGTFFSFGLDECAGLGAAYTSVRFRDGLHDLRDAVMKPTGNWGSYFIPGTDHTWIGYSAYYDTEVDGVRLVDWLEDLLAGEVRHVSP